MERSRDRGFEILFNILTIGDFNMNEDQNFDKRNALNAELGSLMNSLSASSSSIGDWKVIKVYEARMEGKPDPYDFDVLVAQRQAVRDRINVVQKELEDLDK